MTLSDKPNLKSFTETTGFGGSVPTEEWAKEKPAPREWWIKIPIAGEFRFWTSDISTAPDCMETEGDFRNAVHVIEKCTYDALQARVTMTEKLRSADCAYINQLCEERDKLTRELAEAKTEEANRCEEFAEALGEVGIDVSCCYDFSDMVGQIASLVHEAEVEKLSKVSASDVLKIKTEVCFADQAFWQRCVLAWVVLFGKRATLSISSDKVLFINQPPQVDDPKGV